MHSTPPFCAVEKFFAALPRVEFSFFNAICLIFCRFYAKIGTMEDLKYILAENLAKYRKAANLTQAELAEKINYSDKAVSKWERAGGMPDVDVLKQIADLYGVTVDTLLTKSDKPVKLKRKVNLLTRTNVIICSVLLVWLLATAIFVFSLLAVPELDRIWLAFVYAVPVSCIVLLVFNCIWGKTWLSILIITGLIFSLAAAIFITVPFNNSWLLFIFCIPLELLNIIYFSLRIKNKKKTPLLPPEKEEKDSGE